MKVIVIGSKGFIGSNLFQYFTEKQYDVYGADVVVDYSETGRYFLVDATNSDFHEIFQKETFDFCVNCSGAASVPDSLIHPFRDFSLNTHNVFKLLDAIRQDQPECKFLNISSAAVYGNPLSLPVKESDEVLPVSPYGLHKAMSEQICREFYDVFNIPTLSLRVFSAYGEGLKKQLFWDLYHKAVNQEEKAIGLFGSGRESRDFIYIKDLVRLIELLALNAEFNGTALNAASGREVFIDDAVKIFYGFFEKPVPYQFTGKMREGDPVNWVADISKLKKLGFKPEFSLEEGLKNYFEWIKTTA